MWRGVMLGTGVCFATLAFGDVGFYRHKGSSIEFSYDGSKTVVSVNVQSGSQGFAAMGFAIADGKDRLLPVTFKNGAIGVMRPRLVVRYMSAVDEKDLERKGLNAKDWEKASYNSKLVYIDTKDALEAMSLAQIFVEDPQVKYAHPLFHFPIEARSAANEPLFDQQWHLENTGQRGGTEGSDLRVREAWQITEGSENTVIGLIDLGFEQDHPDLEGAWLINEGEIPGNRIDDDGNGLVDDVRGWNYDLDNNQLLYGSSNSHGTATAGLIGAPANGVGVSGVCPSCRVLPIVIYSDIEDAVAAFYYARDRGASVISNSWGYRIGTPRTELLEEALSDVALNGRGGKGISILFAMPNFGSDACRSASPDISAHPDVLAISSVDFHDRKVEASGFGACLKFVGPTSESQTNALVTTDRMGDRGYNRPDAVYADLVDQDYTQSFYGTSAATPALAGVFGLIYSVRSDFSAARVLEIVIETADKISPADAQYDVAGFSERYGFGRPNAAASVLAASVSD